MTYCVAWKSRSTAYLISDTALTINDTSGNYKPVKTNTSIGESTFTDKNITVEEWALKQFRIESNFIVCYSGEVEKALEVIRVIKKFYLKDNPLRSFELAIDSVRNPDQGETVQFLFSFCLNKEIRLFSYNVNHDSHLAEIPEDTLVQIGSLSSSDYSKLTNRFFKDHVLTLDTSAKQFYQFLSYFQHLGLHDNTLKKFAGGLYSGLYLDNAGSHWNDDTAITIYNTNLANRELQLLGRVNYFIRYDCLILFSTFTTHKELFVHSPDHPVYKSLDLQDEIDKIHYSFVPKIQMFLAKNERIVATIKTNGSNNNIHFSEENNNGHFKMKYPLHFIELLKGKPFPKNTFFKIYWDEIF